MRSELYSMLYLRSIAKFLVISAIFSLPGMSFASATNAVGSTTGDSATRQDDFHWHGEVAPGSTIEIRGVHGFVHAQASTGTEVDVAAVKHSFNSNPDSVRIVTVVRADGVTICALYPDRTPAEPNECRPGGGRNNVINNDVHVDFTVRVPQGIRFVGATVNGDVQASALTGEVEAHSVNGSIRVSTNALATASTVNGSVEVTMGKADWKGTLALATVNGQIELSLPHDVSTEVEAETVTGHIASDFPILVTNQIGLRRLEGTIGSGGRRLTLKSVTGSLSLLRR